MDLPDRPSAGDPDRHRKLDLGGGIAGRTLDRGVRADGGLGGLKYPLVSDITKKISAGDTIEILQTEPDIGEIYVDGKDVCRLKRKDLSELRSQIGYVFQNAALTTFNPTGILTTNGQTVVIKCAGSTH